MEKIIKNGGFTLVELSIVLVIIGLLVGGVLQGRELIAAAERNALIADLTKYKVAVNTFKLQYNGAIPGDFDEATDYWGEASNCPLGGDPASGTCDGDGDGKILRASYTAGSERQLFAQHLGLSEIVPGNFNSAWPAGSINSEEYILPIAGDNINISALYSEPRSDVFYENFGNKNYYYIGVHNTTDFNIYYGADT